jgi:hypothetical protein
VRRSFFLGKSFSPMFAIGTYRTFRRASDIRR